jgi:hypothetical protein
MFSGSSETEAIMEEIREEESRADRSNPADEGLTSVGPREQKPLKPLRPQSTVHFPYNDLDDAVEVAKKVWEPYGGSCEIVQLAGAFQQTPGSGAFRTKVLAAKSFGLVQGTNKLTLTPLGYQVVDPKQERAARSEAFLRPGLFRVLYDAAQDSGGLLPSGPALDNLIQRSGVVPKQVANARNMFLRSAKQAGFREHGDDRLVRPATASVRDETPSRNIENNATGGGGERTRAMDSPLITGLLEMLPDPKDGFDENQRQLWLATFEQNLAFIYSVPAKWVFKRPDSSQSVTEREPVHDGS